MKILKNILLVALLILTQIAYGQVSFSHSVGGAIYVAGEAASPGIVYSPRLNFMELGDEITLSIGTHIAGWLAIDQSEGSGGLALDVPIVTELNFGHAAHPDAESSFGGFLGAGYGISKIGAEDSFGSSYNDARGFVFNGGLRFGLKKGSFGTRVSYMLNTNEEYKNVIGLGVFLTL